MGLLDYLPQPPWEGPPLPRVLKQRWPWCETEAETEVTTCEYCNPEKVLITNQQIMALHKEGIPAVEIGARLGVAPELVRYRLRRVGLETIPARRFLEAEQRRGEIIQLHEQGLSAKEVAKKLGLEWSFVCRRLREAKLEPRPSAEKVIAAQAKAGEIIRLAKEGVPLHLIARQTGTSWPLISDILHEAEVRPTTTASSELATWTSELLPLIENISKAHPDAEPSLEKARKLRDELTAIVEAIHVEEGKLPWRGTEAEKERWKLAFISQNAYSCLDMMDALEGCIKSLDVEKLPMLLDQARVCVTNISEVMSGAVAEAAATPRR